MTRQSTVIAVVFLCGLLGHTQSQENGPTTGEIINKISNTIDFSNLTESGIPDVNTINASAIPALQEAKNLFKQKCDKNGGEQAFENANKAKDKVEQCFKSIFNMTQLQAEMEKYKPTGDLDIVFKNYCQKTSVFKKCLSNFTAAIVPCLEPEERENQKIIKNFTDSVLSFVCFKEGDRIALFISAGGPDCLQSKEQQIQNCVNATFGSYIPPGGLNGGSLGLDSLPRVVFGNKECTDISTVQDCIVKELEKCNDPTPANIVDSLFNYMLRVTPCQKLMGYQLVSSASSSAINLAAMSIVLLLLRYM